MQRDGFKMLLPKHVETEFLFSKAGAENMTKRQAFLQRFGFQVDNIASQVPLAQVRAWTDQATAAGLGHGDAKMVAHVKASAQVRKISNPVLLSQNTKDFAKMRLQGVNTLKFEVKPVAPPKSVPVQEVPRPAAPEVPTGRPPPAGGRPPYWQRLKAGARMGLKDLMSAESLIGLGVSLAAMALQHIADKAAAEAAIKRIQIFFIKEGFAKGFAAGVLGWAEDDVATDALNRVNHPRVRGMGDAAGMLKLSHILKLAEAYENYAVAVGWNYATWGVNEWKAEVLAKGFAYLEAAGYGHNNWYRGQDPEVYMYEYDYLVKLGWALRAQSDAIVGPAIRTGK